MTQFIDMDYRLKDDEIRTEYFHKYFYWSLKFYDCDSSLFLLNYIYKRMELNLEQRYWMAWLYGNTYQLATSWVIANEFPDFENVNLNTLTDWNNLNYKRLRYQNDQKWQRGHLPQMFDSYKNNVLKNHSNQHDFFINICDSDNANDNFDKLYNYIVKNFYKFGRYSAWFYIQTLKETCGLNVEPRDLLLKDENTHTQRAGLCYSIGLDELAEDKKLNRSKDIVDLLDTVSFSIIDTMKQKHPKLKCDMFLLETTLCAYKKTFREKKGRYLGYYLDRQFEDIKQVQEDGWNGIDWDLLWDGRNEILDPRTNRTKGVVVEDMKYFLKTGKILNYEYCENN